MNIHDWLCQAERRLEKSACPDPSVDAMWIAEDILKLTRTELHFAGTDDLSRENADALENALRRRETGEPVQYILGHAEFMGLSFEVNSHVLIPRQDTETLCEALIIEAEKRNKCKVLDLCTGSGAIGVSLKSLVPGAQVTLSDLSREALELAGHNAKRLGCEVTLRHGDLFEAVKRERFDIIASNPPYLRADEMAELQKEVEFEPRLALDGGEDGLCVYRRIAKELGAHLEAGGCVLLETGAGQGEDVLSLLDKELPLREGRVINDLNGIGRVVFARI